MTLTYYEKETYFKIIISKIGWCLFLLNWPNVWHQRFQYLRRKRMVNCIYMLKLLTFTDRD